MYEINSHTRYFEDVKPFYCTHFQGLLMIEILLLKVHFQHLKQFQFQNKKLKMGI